MADFFVELDERRLRTQKVLNDGFVTVVDYMGRDQDIIDAARVSYGKGTKRIREDRDLIRYLYRHQHGTPFEMCVIKLHVRAPIDVVRQWMRHRVATYSSFNEYSTRYSTAIESMTKTPPEGWRRQDQANKQGSAGTFGPVVGAELSKEEEEFHLSVQKRYKMLLELGVAREQARKDLLLCNYTEFYTKVDLRNLLDFLYLRNDPHAQLEIRQYAEAISRVVKIWCPLAWEAFEDYRLRSITLSYQEAACLGLTGLLTNIIESESFPKTCEENGLTKREVQELTTKVRTFRSERII